MITHHAVHCIYDLANQATESNINLVPKDESPLTALVAACISPTMASGLGQVYPVDAPEQSTGSLDFVAVSAMKGFEGASEHDLVMDELVETIAGTVSRSLSWARNEVAPQISVVYENAVKAIAQAELDAASPYHLVPFFWPEVYNDSALANLYNNYEHSTKESLALKYNLPLPEGLTAVQLLATGVGSADAAIGDLIAAVGPELINEVYEHTFGVERYAFLDDVVITELPRAWHAIIVMLMASAFQQKIPDGLNIPLGDYQQYVATILSQSGLQAARYARNRLTDAKNGRLVISFRRGGGVIVANGDLYNTWLTEGGTPEIVLGAAIGEPSTFPDGQTLLADKDRYLQAYNHTASLLSSTTQYKKFDALIASFRSSVAAIIEAIPEDELKVPRAILYSNLTWRLTRLHIHDLEDLHIPSRKIVCRTLWQHTDVEQYLEAMESVAKANPALNAREAAALAAVDVTVNWLAGQLSLVRVN